ncbi:DUF2167 domain-containing protein [Bordetella sp. LUAb4]|uniref:DUF2167 domain-containing protein n=1 Tax=Bordetella sp. LUAb4 TaxID=2843195 RepID=UPI001E4DDEA6|nr:DUF2167 domain-containing protein [Bordetella sp. LUAb4]
MPVRFLLSCMIAVISLGFAPTVPAQTKAEMQEREAADEALAQATQHSGVVRLGDQATLTLSPGVDFVPAAAANRQILAYGGLADDAVLGYLKPAANSGKNWFIEVYFKKYGYIKDEDTKAWDAGKLLQNLQYNYEWLNERRRGGGAPEIEAIGWLYPPQYDRARHRLVYAIDAREKGVPRRATSRERCTALTLGREGFVELKLTSDRSTLAADIPVVLKLLDSFAYDEGKRYEDFNASTDKVADFGLAYMMGAHSHE